MAIRSTFQADPILKLVVIEAVEATGKIFQAATTKVTQELQTITQKKYRYFGEFHLVAESSHATDSPSGEKFVEEIQLSEATRQKAFELVEKVFAIFTEFMDELLAYANNHNLCQAKKNIVTFERARLAA